MFLFINITHPVNKCISPVGILTVKCYSFMALRYLFTDLTACISLAFKYIFLHWSKHLFKSLTLVNKHQIQNSEMVVQSLQ